jgi:hypothetical protein
MDIGALKKLQIKKKSHKKNFDPLLCRLKAKSIRKEKPNKQMIKTHCGSYKFVHLVPIND